MLISYHMCKGISFFIFATQESTETCTVSIYGNTCNITVVLLQQQLQVLYATWNSRVNEHVNK